MRKHAYLIIANKNWRQVGLLLKLLDHPRNDLFLLIDHKADFNHDWAQYLQSCVKKSNYHLLTRFNIYWGGILKSRRNCSY